MQETNIKRNRWIEENFSESQRTAVRLTFSQGWRAQISLMCNTVLSRRLNTSELLSIKTKAETKNVLMLCFEQLRDLGFKLDSVLSFREAHLIALLKLWRLHCLAPGTISERLSKLRAFAAVIGKNGMVPEVSQLGRLGIDPKIATRSSTATQDRSWSASGIDIDAKLADMFKRDRRAGHILTMQHAFGLRAKEAVRLDPHAADRGSLLRVIDGTKGGRERFVPIDSPERRALLDAAKLDVQPGDSLSGKIERSLEAALRWFYRHLEAIGISRKASAVTSHGLRHEYAHKELQARGAPVPVKQKSRKPTTKEERYLIKNARVEVAEALGHSRTSVTAAYAGGIIVMARKRALETGRLVTPTQIKTTIPCNTAASPYENFNYQNAYISPTIFSIKT
jgi:integrase